MKWLNGDIGSLLSVFGLDLNGRIGGSIQFFLYDTIKIMVLLGVVLSFMMGVTTLSLPSIYITRFSNA